MIFSRLIASFALPLILVSFGAPVAGQGITRNPSSIANQAQVKAPVDGEEPSALHRALQLLRDTETPIDERIREAAQIVAADPDVATSWAVLGELRMEAGESTTALLAFERAVAKDPTLASSWHWIGTLKKRSGNMEEALEAFRKALANGAPRSQQMNEIAVTLAQLRRPDEAIRQWDEAIEEDPEWGVLYANAMMAARQRGNERLARQYFERGLKADRFEEVMVLMWGDHLLERGREREALAAYEAGLERAPQSPRILYAYGMTLKERRQIDDATATLEASRQAAIAQEDFPTREAAAKALFSIQHPDAHGRLIRATEKVNTPWSAEDRMESEMNEARGLLDSVIAEHPDLWEPYLLRGTALRRLSEVEFAKEDFERVLDAVPDQPNALINLAILELEEGQVERSMDYSRQAIDAPGSDWTIALTAGFLYLEAGDCDRAREMIRETRRRLPRGFPDDPTQALTDEIAAICG